MTVGQTKRIWWDKWADKKEKRGREKRKKKGAERGKEKKEKKGSPLLSKIYGDRAVGFRRSKRQSSSTQQELRVGTKIIGFR